MVKIHRTGIHGYTDGNFVKDVYTGKPEEREEEVGHAINEGG